MSLPKADTKQRVLLGAAGTGTSFALATRLRAVWGDSVHLVGMDINPRHLVTTSLLCDSFYQVAEAHESKFLDDLTAIILNEEISTFCPILNNELTKSPAIVANPLTSAVDIVAPDLIFINLAVDKYALSKWLEAIGVPTPKTYLPEHLEAERDYFVKPRDGFGSHDARVVAKDSLSKIPLNGMVLQTICQPPEVTIDSFFDEQTGYRRAACRERLEIKSGVCTKARIFQDDQLSEYARRIGAALKQRGTICFQAMRDCDGWVVTDVNFRPGAGSVMTCAAGWDVLSATFACRWGEPYEHFFPDHILSDGVFVTRQYTEFVSDTRT